MGHSLEVIKNICQAVLEDCHLTVQKIVVNVQISSSLLIPSQLRIAVRLPLPHGVDENFQHRFVINVGYCITRACLYHEHHYLTKDILTTVI